MSDERLFKLDGGKFIRQTDGKEIAQLVDGKIVGLHHKQEKFRETLHRLVSPRDVADLNDDPEGAPSLEFVIDQTPRELFTKRLGDQTPEVIAWRLENWTAEQFEDRYTQG